MIKLGQAWGEKRSGHSKKGRQGGADLLLVGVSRMVGKCETWANTKRNSGVTY